MLDYTIKSNTAQNLANIHANRSRKTYNIYNISMNEGDRALIYSRLAHVRIVALFSNIVLGLNCDHRQAG